MPMPVNHHKVENSRDARQEGGTNSTRLAEGQDAALEQEPQSNVLPQKMGWFKQSLQQSSFKFSVKHMPIAGSDRRLAVLDCKEPTPRPSHASPCPSHASARPYLAKVLKRTL
jgi:hypothetical protein